MSVPQHKVAAIRPMDFFIFVFSFFRRHRGDRVRTSQAIVGLRTRPPKIDDCLFYGWKIANEIARLDIGQTVIVKNGTGVALEALEGTNETIGRGALARKDAIMVKVAKPNQDMRFD